MKRQNRFIESLVQVRGTRVGTGFFIGEDGTLLTCFHLIRDDSTGEVTKEAIVVLFKGREYQAECVHAPFEFRELDAAILRLTESRLPSGAILFPLGKWDSKQPEEFLTAGSRSPNEFSELHAEGRILGRTSIKPGKPLLQLSSESINRQTIRGGMSGAPVYSTASDQIVGMIVRRYLEPGGEGTPAEIIPLALPMDEIAHYWFPIRMRMREEELLTHISRLVKIGEWFTEKALKSFYDSLSTILPGLTPYDELGHDKSQGLLDQIRFAGSVQDLVNFMRFLRKDIPSEELPLAEWLEPPLDVTFVNREAELASSCNLYAPPILLYEAPLGYGKTELLRAIEHRHFIEGWLCILVSVNGQTTTAEQLIRDIVISAGQAKLLPLLDDISYIGSTLAARLQLRMHHFKAQGLLLIVDNVERLSASEAEIFLSTFLPAVQSTLSKFRARLGGGYLPPSWPRKAKDLQIEIRSLSPFNLRAVRDMVKLRSTKQVDTWAAHLMYLTGGHPGCLIEIMSLMDFSAMSAEELARSQREYRKIVLDTICRVREFIPSELVETFDVLSIFRRYNFRLLEKMMSERLLPYKGGASDLERALTATYLVRRKEGFIQDEIVRRLLAARLRFEDPGRFLHLCEKARAIYTEELQKSISRLELVTIEVLFQELQLKYHQGNQTLDSRIHLHKEFFADNGVLQNCLEILAAKPDAPDIFADLQNHLESEHDWEFRFAINYLLRDEEYTDAPYQLLVDRVKSFSMHRAEKEAR